MDLLKLTIKEFTRMASLIYDRTGIHLPQEKLNLLSNRLRKRLKALELESFSQYYDLIASEEGCKAELPHFLSAVTTNETYFFRNQQLWDYFSSELIEHFVKVKPASNRSLRIWSAASSTGAEAYTAAIVLTEKLPIFSQWRVTIIGSDISEKVLDDAKAGRYKEYAVSKMDAARVKRYFTRKDDILTLNDNIRKMVRFQFHNLRDPFPNARFDLVFLRNVLMYFDNEMKKRVLGNVSNALIPGGRLIVGDVDPIRTVPELRDCMSLEYSRPGVYIKPMSPSLTAGERKAVLA